MTVDTEFLNKIKDLAAYGYGPKTLIRLLELPLTEEKAILLLFEDPDSEVSRAHEIGKAQASQYVMQKLKGHVDTGGEGAGESARALGYFRKKQEDEDFFKELFDV
jgi:hypothetical protein